MTYPKLQFHTIDALRFFAFLKVFITHFPYDLDNPVIKFLKQGGGIGVAFFFVLSGFLITYILVNEKFHTGKINAKSFFLRRILRIWPVYFLLLLFLYLLPNWILAKAGYIGNGYSCDWFYSFSFTENYRMIYLDAIPNILPLGVIWSLCIEEHFYIIWFFVISFIPLKKLPYAFAGTIFVAIISRFLYTHFYPNNYITTNELLTNFDLFGVGAILGYLTVTKYDWLTNLIKKIPIIVKLFYLVTVIIIVIFLKIIFKSTENVNFLHPTFLSILFTGVIAIFIPIESKLKIKNSNILSYFGRISYGLYMYHSLVIIFLFVLAKAFQIEIDSPLQLLLSFIVMLACSIFISIASYYLIEKQILKLREKFR